MKQLGLGCCIGFWLHSLAAMAQLNNLQVTEVMYNPVGSSEARFEWIEVQNTGSTQIDLDGYILSDWGYVHNITDPPANPVSISSIASGGLATHTIVPARGVAVLYNGAAFNFDDSRFRAGWNLPADVPLIAVDAFPTLNNAGAARHIGFWETPAEWELDTVAQDTDSPPDGLNDRRVVSGFDNAALNFSYAVTSGFPTAADGQSIAWTGSGMADDGANWMASNVGIAGARASMATFLASGSRLNGEDVASPNVLPQGSAPAGVYITEIMVDPGEGRDAPGGNAYFEWVEMYNATGTTLDLSGYVFDDDDGIPLGAANIVSGSIASGDAGVLFDAGDLEVADMETIWGSGNYIPVTNWPNLNNLGDTIGIWSSLQNYKSEGEGGRALSNTIAAVTYEQGANGWPEDIGDGSSIYLSQLNAPGANDNTVTGTPATGSLWLRSVDATEPIARTAQPLFGEVMPDYQAGDIGSPGTIGEPLPTLLAGDFNGDSQVDSADYTVWRDLLGSTVPGVLNGNGDESSGSAGIVDVADYLYWKTALHSSPTGDAVVATAVPEPGSLDSISILILFACSSRYTKWLLRSGYSITVRL